MSLLNSQTIFNILITLIICSAMFIFFRFKLRVLEISQTEQAKVLQSLVMSMRNGGHHRNIDMESSEEAMKHRQRQMQMQMQMQQNGGIGGSGGSGGSGGGVNQHNHANDLINVSDEEGDDDEDEDDESESSSDSDDDSDSSLEDDNEETHDNTTKKIIFNNNGTLDAHTHPIEHLTGDDIKVIELTEPLYAVGGGGGNVSGAGAGSKHDTNDVSDDDDNDGDDDDNEDMSDDDNDDEETSDDTEVKIEELPNHASLSLQQELPSHEHEQHLETSVTDITEIKTIFKADKQQQQHIDYNSMNAQALKQHLKTKLSADGIQYNETAINKLGKKELIKHLTQG